MKKFLEKFWSSRAWWLLLMIVIIIVNFIASKFHSRFDLTKEKRYTLSKATKELLKNLEEPVRIDVFVGGKDLPAQVRRFRNTLNEFLNDSKEYSRGLLTFRFFNPYENAADTGVLNRLEDSLNYNYGLFPSLINAPGKVGDKLEITKLVHGAVISYRDKTAGVNLLKGLKGYGTEPEQLAALYNDMEATLEYKFASAIQKITNEKKPVVAYAMGHGEAWGYNVDDAVRTLLTDYSFDTINIKKAPYIPSGIDVLVVLKPTESFSDADKLKIDQYVMRGGKLFLMIDNMYAEFDSLYKTEGFIAYDRGLNLEDILFRYGVRINLNLLQDMQCDKLGQISNDPNNPQTRLVDWPFFPILNGTNHPVSKNLDGVRAMFPNTLDTVKAEGIKKTFLLKSSSNARVLPAPARVDFEFLQIAPDAKTFTVRDTGVAVLLEGKFRSLYASRVSKALADSLQAMNAAFKNIPDEPTKMIVVADGDIALNQFSPQYGPMPMGHNFYTRYTYSNKEFFTNSLDYLVNPPGILETRAKDFTLRLLDPVKVRDQKSLWQFLNIGLPVLLVVIFGFIYQQARKRKFASA